MSRRFHAPALDGLRAVAFAVVFLSHLPGRWAVFPGGFGVTVFFFLSGYLITTLLRIEVEETGRIDLPAFFGRRALRILPPYYLILALVWAAGLAGALGPGAVGVEALPWQAGFATNYWMVAHRGRLLPPGSEVYWSLAVEEHYYLLFPFAAVGLFRAPPSVRSPLLLGACGLVLGWRILLFTVLDPGDADRLTYATDTRIDAILFGAALALARNPALDGAPWTARWGGPALAAAGLALGATLVPRDPLFRETVRYSLQGLLLWPVYTVLLTRPDLARPLEHPLVRRVGALSYALYLVHDSAIAAVHAAWPGAPAAAVGGLAFAGSWGVAEALHRAVERPLAGWRARLRRGVR